LAYVELIDGQWRYSELDFTSRDWTAELRQERTEPARVPHNVYVRLIFTCIELTMIVRSLHLRPLTTPSEYNAIRRATEA